MTAVPASLPGSSGLRLRLIIAALTFLPAGPLLLAWTLATSDRPTTAVVWGGLALAALTFGLLCLVGGAIHRDLGLSRWKTGSLNLLVIDSRNCVRVAARHCRHIRTGTAGMISWTLLHTDLWPGANDSNADRRPCFVRRHNCERRQNAPVLANSTVGKFRTLAPRAPG